MECAMNEAGRWQIIQIERADARFAEVVEVCAALMADSDPWLTLGYTYQDGIRLLSNPLAELYVAFEGERVIGFALLLMYGALRGYIQSIGVVPQWRGQGVGSRLLQAVEARVFKETPNVFLCVSSFNQNAQWWYRRMGYQVIGELQDYLVVGHSEILMRKTIGPLRRTVAGG